MVHQAPLQEFEQVESFLKDRSEDTGIRFLKKYIPEPVGPLETHQSITKKRTESDDIQHQHIALFK